MKILRTGSVSRARWAAIGAAIAVSLGVGGVAITHAVVTSGERDIFVPISPCRLFDYRPAPDQVGPRGTALQPGETYTQSVRGANGNCNIPADATAIAMNVTAVGGTAGSFLTIWPSDVAPKPLASNLNWVPGSPPTPNKVDVKVSVADGKINLFNLTGTVFVLADVVGYYADHNFDDRYYTKAQVDTTLSSNITMSHGLYFFTNGAGPQAVQNFLDVSRLPVSAINDLQLVGPKSINGVSYGLLTVTYCMHAATGTNLVTVAEVAASAPALLIKSDPTDRTAAGCYTITVNDAVSTAFTLSIFTGGAAGNVDITGVTSVWAPVGLIPASAAAASTSGGEGTAP